MKGLVLAGGTATRLFPLTIVTNKHLLPIYDRPMIYYPIETLVGMGIRETMVVLGEVHVAIAHVAYKARCPHRQAFERSSTIRIRPSSMDLMNGFIRLRVRLTCLIRLLSAVSSHEFHT
jgi:NDP-sugar pyrophosphorylase family protein